MSLWLKLTPEIVKFRVISSLPTVKCESCYNLDWLELTLLINSYHSTQFTDTSTCSTSFELTGKDLNPFFLAFCSSIFLTKISAHLNLEGGIEVGEAGIKMSKRASVDQACQA